MSNADAMRINANQVLERFMKRQRIGEMDFASGILLSIAGTAIESVRRCPQLDCWLYRAQVSAHGLTSAFWKWANDRPAAIKGMNYLA